MHDPAAAAPSRPPHPNQVDFVQAEVRNDGHQFLLGQKLHLGGVHGEETTLQIRSRPSVSQRSSLGRGFPATTRGPAP